MRGARGRVWLGCSTAILLAGCGEIEPNAPLEPTQQRAQTKRQQTACGSSRAYAALKGRLFDQAQVGFDGDRANLDMLADYSTVRMESPVVEGRGEAIDLTRCSGRLILYIPPGAERGFGGDRRLQADIRYTAQPAADGSGLVYRLTDAEPIVTRLAGFSLTSGAFRPPPAIDQQKAAAEPPAPPEPVSVEVAEAAPSPPRPVARQPVERAGPRSAAASGGEATVRAFYSALRAGDGESAAAQVVPEKRGSEAYSAGAITRFFGRLPEPIALTDVHSVGEGAYRVRYRYSAGRSRCNGTAVVRTANRDDRDLIRSIDALNGC